MTRYAHIVISLLIILTLQACGGAGVAPVSQRKEVKEPAPGTTQRSTTATQKKQTTRASAKSGYHIVEKGDTLYSIAWRYNFDYKNVAEWNKIKSPYTIYPGQLVRLKPIPKKKGETLKPQPVKPAPPKPATTKPPVQPKTKPAIAPKKPATVAKKKSANPPLPKGPIKWNWPTQGKLVKSNSPTSKKGIDISGRNGQTIKAAATGEVVYSGSGLLGYGKLIIIKHNDTYLSAYAYNSKLLVEEGDRVIAGQSISKMGQDHTGRNVLHFEIRKNGKPIDPVRYLPKKRA